MLVQHQAKPAQHLMADQQHTTAALCNPDIALRLIGRKALRQKYLHQRAVTQLPK